MAEVIIDDSPANPYQDKFYRDCWLEHLASPGGYNEHYGSFSLYSKRIARNMMTARELQFSGGRTLYQDFTDARVEEFASLTQSVSWDSMVTVWADSRRMWQAHEALQALGYPVLHGRTRPMHVVDLSNGFEGYLASRKARQRYDIGRNLRQAHRCNLVTIDTFEGIDGFFDQFFEHHRAYWMRKTGAWFFEQSENREFAVAWAKAVFPTGRLRLQQLYVDGELANLSTGLMDSNTFHWILTTNTGAKSALFPGLLGLYQRMQQAADEGATLFNMQHGNYRYKLTACTHSIERRILVVTNPRSLRGKLMSLYYKNRLKHPRFKCLST